MANLFKQLKALQTNIFGGPGNTGETKPPATRVQDIDLRSSPTGILGTDPFSSHVLNYPLDVQQNFQNGHYMIFYVNVQDKTKYEYKNKDDAAGTMKDLMNVKLKGLSQDEARYARLQAIKTGQTIGDRKVSSTDGSTYTSISYDPMTGE